MSDALITLWDKYQSALRVKDDEEAMRLARQIADSPAESASGVHVKAMLLSELEQPETLPSAAISGRLIASLVVETKAVAAGILPIVA